MPARATSIAPTCTEFLSPENQDPHETRPDGPGAAEAALGGSRERRNACGTPLRTPSPRHAKQARTAQTFTGRGKPALAYCVRVRAD